MNVSSKAVPYLIIQILTFLQYVSCPHVILMIILGGDRGVITGDILMRDHDVLAFVGVSQIIPAVTGDKSAILMRSRDISSSFCEKKKTGIFKPKHNLFKTLTLWFCVPVHKHSITTALLQDKSEPK